MQALKKVARTVGDCSQRRTGIQVNGPRCELIRQRVKGKLCRSPQPFQTPKIKMAIDNYRSCDNFDRGVCTESVHSLDPKAFRDEGD